MRVTRVRLKNWKNFQNVDVPLGPRMFLIGTNAAGKSNFLDALRFIGDVAEHGVSKAVQRRGGLTGLRCLYARKESSIGLGFTLDETWDYELELTESKQFPLLIKRECVRKDGTTLLERPDNADKADAERRTQTALEQVFANQDFRDIANFFKCISYRHVLPQIVRDPQSFTPFPVADDPYGRDFVHHIWATPAESREDRLRRIAKVLQSAIPSLFGLKVEKDANPGQPHLVAEFQLYSSGKLSMNEDSLSDGTLRLIELFWTLLEKGGLLLLEEPESSLNEDIVRCLASLFGKFALSKQGRQIIVSTHSYALLDDPGIQPEEMLKLESGKAGAVVQPLSDDSVQLMKNGLTAAEAAFPEIRHSNCFTFLLSSQFHV